MKRFLIGLPAAGVLFFLAQLGYSEEYNVDELWQKVVQANKAWLEPYTGDVMYEFSYYPAGGGQQSIEIWYKGNDKAKIRYIDGTNIPPCYIYNNGILRAGSTKNYQYLFKNTSPVFSKNTGYGVTPLVVLMHKNAQFKLVSAWKVLWKAREVYCIETVYNPLPVYGNFFSMSFIDMERPNRYSLYIDAKTFEILKEESSLDLSNRSGTFIGEYPEGFNLTSEGFVPKHYFAYLYGNKSTNYNAWYEQSDQKIWYQKKGSFRAGTYINSFEAKTVSLKPIDEKVFFMDPAEIDAKDPKSGESVLQGKVLDIETRQPIQNATVQLLQDASQTRTPEKGITKTDEKGNFQFNHISLRNRPRYWAIAEKAGLVSAKIGESISSESSLPSIDFTKQCLNYVSLNNNNTQQTIEIFLSTPRSIKGKVVETGTQNPVKGATVEVLTSSLRIKKVLTSDDGSFAIDALPACKLMIVAYADHYAEKEWISFLGKDNRLDHLFYLSPEDPAGQTIDLSQPRSIEPLLLKLNKGKTLEGVITDINGNPAETAIVSLGIPAVKPTVTDQNGFYQFKNLNIQSKQEQLIAAIANGFVKSASLIKEFQLDTTVQNLTLCRGGYLSGTITGEKNQPLPDIKIVLQRIYGDVSDPRNRALSYNFPMDNFYPDFSNPGVTTPLITDAKGNFKTKALIPGIYQFTASAPGWLTTEIADIRIEDVSETSVKATLLPSNSAAVSPWTNQ